MTDKVELVNGNKFFTTEAGETILAAALRQGVVIPHNCRNGFCGSCMGLLRDGEVEHGAERPRGLSEEMEKAGYILCCRAVTKGDIRLEVDTIDAVAELPIKTLPCRVSRLEKLSADVMLLELKLPPHDKLEFRAGQYLDILLPDGRRRSFSMANSPSSCEKLELHVRHVSGGSFTGQVFNEMKVKDMLRIQGPFGTFIMRDDDTRPAILIGGGTGLAPLKSMLEKVREEGCVRPLYLYWGVRSASDLYFHEELQRWERELECLHYTPVLSEAGEAGDWAGATGWVHEAVLSDFPDLAGLDIYASGPPPMIDAIQRQFPANGLEQGHFYFDSFEYASDGS